MGKIFDADKLFNEHISHLSSDEVRKAIRLWLFHYHGIQPEEVVVNLCDSLTDSREVRQDKMARILLREAVFASKLLLKPEDY